MNIDLLKKEDLAILRDEIKELKKEMKFHAKSNRKEWVPESEAMEILNVSKSTIQKFRKEGLLPWSQYKNLISYKHSDLMKFFEDHYTGNRNYLTSKMVAA